MAKHVLLYKFTEKGITNLQQSPDRAEAFVAAAGKMGVKVEKILWLTGPYDGLALVDAPDDETVAALALGVAKLGNVIPCTCRAYESAEFRQVLGKMK